jgi:hypothetical protein
MGGVQFFMGKDSDDDKDSESEDDLPDLKALRHGQLVGKKTKSKERQIALAKAVLKKVPESFDKAQSLNRLERTQSTSKTARFEFLGNSFITRPSSLC